MDLMNPSFWSLVLLLLADVWRGSRGACPMTGSSATAELKVALLYPVTGDMRFKDLNILNNAAAVVVRKLNEECAVPGFNLTYEVYDTRCHVGTGIVAMANAMFRGGAKAFIGNTNCSTSSTTTSSTKGNKSKTEMTASASVQGNKSKHTRG